MTNITKDPAIVEMVHAAARSVIDNDMGDYSEKVALEADIDQLLTKASNIEELQTIFPSLLSVDAWENGRVGTRVKTEGLSERDAAIAHISASLAEIYGPYYGLE